MIRVILPAHLRTLARVGAEVALEVKEPVTAQAVIDALEAKYPMLLGTVRDAASRRRRPFVRYFACGEDISHEPAETALPPPVARGQEPFLILGAIAGG